MGWTGGSPVPGGLAALLAKGDRGSPWMDPKPGPVCVELACHRSPACRRWTEWIGDWGLWFVKPSKRRATRHGAIWASSAIGARAVQVVLSRLTRSGSWWSDPRQGRAVEQANKPEESF